ncbi:MAG: ATP-binding protein [Bacteroidales bacterium]|nr:ATP-binding protein [Bacteroidales bacterium]
MYKREIESEIVISLNNKEIIIIYGARQVGKTTLIYKLLADNKNAIILNCERPHVKDILESRNLTQIKMLFNNKKIVALDEAQKIADIGLVLKLIYDLPEFTQKIIATGSGSFELANKIVEPLTGRNIKYKLYPLSIREIVEKKSWLWCVENLEELLLFGSYPGIIDRKINEKPILLQNLSSDYLFKDVLSMDNIRNPSFLRKLLKALAYQLGSQVSYNELAKTLGTSMKTVEKYIDLLEKSFVIFGLSSFNRNLRNELKKSKKYYFFDIGIRNALINNFSPINTRLDKGAIWENFCVCERLKYNEKYFPLTNIYFWRTYDGAEIDMVEEIDGKIKAFEFKFTEKRKSRFPDSFMKTYYPVQHMIVNILNFNEFIFNPHNQNIINPD